MQAQILVAASLVGTLGLAGCASAITPPSVPSTPSSNVDSTICANGDLPTVTQGTVTIATDSPVSRRTLTTMTPAMARDLSRLSPMP